MTYLKKSGNLENFNFTSGIEAIPVLPERSGGILRMPDVSATSTDRKNDPFTLSDFITLQGTIICVMIELMNSSRLYHTKFSSRFYHTNSFSHDFLTQ